MSDLPTREETSTIFQGSPNQGDIVIAYVSGRLMTRQEFIDELKADGKRITDDLVDWRVCLVHEQVRSAVDVVCYGSTKEEPCRLVDVTIIEDGFR